MSGTEFTDEYMCRDIIDEARAFIRYLEGEVIVYRRIPDKTEKCEKFLSWWDFKGYEKDIHALFALYETKKALDSEVIPPDCDLFRLYVHRMEEYWKAVEEAKDEE